MARYSLSTSQKTGCCPTIMSRAVPPPTAVMMPIMQPPIMSMPDAVAAIEPDAAKTQVPK
uniref:Uncharacterized protein n=1 Tax=Tetraselmis sp. GSL018 TaxID=582737 RepID=A0A061SLN3_9CHLO